MTVFDILFCMGFEEYGKENYQLSLDCLKLAQILKPEDDCTRLLIDDVEYAMSLQERVNFWSI